MTIPYILAGVALLLNILGRLEILRRDEELGDTSRTGIRFVPGAEVLYLLFRWEKARLGGVFCALSLIVAFPAAHQFLAQDRSGRFAQLLAIGPTAKSASDLSVLRQDPAVLRKELEFRERKVNALTAYLQRWYDSLMARQGYLCDELPEEMADFNRTAAAYQKLLGISKSERAELEKIKSLPQEPAKASNAGESASGTSKVSIPRASERAG